MSKRTKDRPAPAPQPRAVSPVAPPAVPAAPGAAPNPAAAEAWTTLAVVVPVAPPPGEVYISNHIDVHLDRAQAAAIRAAFDGLQETAARLASGRFINSPSDVVRWMAERIADGVGSIVGDVNPSPD